MTIEVEQLALLGQRAVYNEWIVHACGDEPALREDMQPSQFLSELSYISLVECDGDDLIFRIGGTHIRRLMKEEPRGCSLRKMDRALYAPMFFDTSTLALARKQPMMGLTPVPETNDLHCWMRLPLIGKSGAVDVVLCHDRIVDAEKLASGEAERDAADIALSRAA